MFNMVNSTTPDQQSSFVDFLVGLLVFNRDERKAIIPIMSPALVKAVIDVCTRIYQGVICLPPWITSNTHLYNRVRKLFYHMMLLQDVGQACVEFQKHTILFDYIAFSLKYARYMYITDSQISTYQSSSEKKFLGKIACYNVHDSINLLPDCLDQIMNQVFLDVDGDNLDDVFFNNDQSM
jgi:hypothetical protein